MMSELKHANPAELVAFGKAAADAMVVDEGMGTIDAARLAWHVVRSGAPQFTTMPNEGPTAENGIPKFRVAPKQPEADELWDRLAKNDLPLPKAAGATRSALLAADTGATRITVTPIATRVDLCDPDRNAPRT
jgi:hypothetical protein